MGACAVACTAAFTTVWIAIRPQEEIMCDNVCVNGAHYSIELPHGGLKQSGYGKDISSLSLRDYYDIRRISIKR